MYSISSISKFFIFLKISCVIDIPPGSAIDSNLLAIFTLLPKISSSSITTSPMLIPNLYHILSSLLNILSNSLILLCIIKLLSTALIELSNVAKKPSPVVLMILPVYLSTVGLIISMKCFF